MAHLVRDKAKLIARVRRIRGQLDAVERSLAEEADCAESLQLIVSSRGALNGLLAEVLEGHIRSHLGAESRDPLSDESRALEQVVDVIRTYLK